MRAAIETPVTFSGWLPVFVRTDVTTSLVLPTSCVPKVASVRVAVMRAEALDAGEALVEAARVAADDERAAVVERRQRVLLARRASVPAGGPLSVLRVVALGGGEHVAQRARLSPPVTSTVPSFISAAAAVWRAVGQFPAACQVRAAS